jgi:hypothetical protein
MSSAALRGIKAEGGWGVVSTEYCSIDPSSDDTPYGFLTLWDEDDVKALSADHRCHSRPWQPCRRGTLARREPQREPHDAASRC